MWCYRKMLRLSWTKKVTNEEVLKRVGKRKNTNDENKEETA